MKTVIQVVQHLRIGGIESMALDLMRFTGSNDRTVIVSLEGNFKSAVSEWQRLKPYANRLIFLNKKPGLQLSLLYKLKGLFKKLNPDVIHTHHIGPLLYGGLAARLSGVKQLIHTEHDAWHLANPHRRNLQRTIIQLTHPTLVADAKAVAKSMERHLKASDITVIPNGIDAERFCPGNKTASRQQLRLPSSVKIIGCSGRLEKVKGHEILIDALSNLPENVHLAIAGSGSLKEILYQQAEKLGLTTRVYFLGQLDDMPRFYQALDVFCLPSLKEGLPLAPLEAQACNIPAIVTDVGGAHEALCPDTGILVPAHNSHALTKGLRKLLISKSHHSPRDFVQQQADVRTMAKTYASLHTAGC